MLTSTQDKRKYRLITLNNGLKALLVEDANCRLSAASVTVAAGHFQDPDDCHGLAHLLEHMLFLGSESYPEANDLNNFVSLHSGNVNAWTGTEYSNFYFDVQPQYFNDALRRFAHMLAKPLFTFDAITNELHAIDAEFKLKQKDDLRRLYQVHKESCNPEHPFSKFSVGNMQTLGQHEVTELQRKLRQFHKQYYQVNQMMLCVISNQHLSSLENMVRGQFSVFVEAINPPAVPEYPSFYLSEQLGIEIHIQPLKTARRLIVTFALPDTQQYYRTKPLHQISQLLGDEGEGSLLWYLKGKNWATSLSSGGGIHGSNFKDFNISLQLTTEGLDHVDDILQALFHVIELIQADGTCQWRFEERRQLNQLAFEFHDAPKSVDYASYLSAQMFHYPDEHLLIGEFIMDHYDPVPVKDMLALLTPENMRIKLIYPDANTDKQARWYDTPYAIKPLSQERLVKLAEKVDFQGLKLPQANPYVVTRTHPQKPEPGHSLPRMIKQQQAYQFWYGQDNKFNMPKGDLYLSFDCPAVLEGIEMVSLKRLWVNILQEQLTEQYYQAGIAGLHFHLYAHQGGFSLHTNGFADKQPGLAKDLLQHLYEPQLCQKKFEQIRQRHLQGLQNALLNKPINRLFTRLSVLMQRTTYSPLDTAPIIETCTFSDIADVQQRLLSNNHLEVMFYGDWSRAEADALCTDVADLTQRHKHNAKEISRDIVDLRHEQSHLLPVHSHHDDASVVIYFQSPSESIEDIAKSILLEQLWAAPFFNEMRTERQLGYVVGTGYFPFNQHPGIALYIQSPNYSAQALVDAIHEFLHISVDHLTHYPLDEWQHIKSGVIKQLLEKDQSLSMKSQRLWLALGNKDINFNQSEKLSQAIQKTELAQLKQFAERLVCRQGFGETILYCPGNMPAPELLEGHIIKDLNLFKQGAQYIR